MVQSCFEDGRDDLEVLPVDAKSLKSMQRKATNKTDSWWDSWWPTTKFAVQDVGDPLRTSVIAQTADGFTHAFERLDSRLACLVDCGVALACGGGDSIRSTDLFRDLLSQGCPFEITRMKNRLLFDPKSPSPPDILMNAKVKMDNGRYLFFEIQLHLKEVYDIKTMQGGHFP